MKDNQEVRWIRLGEFIEQSDKRNTDCEYGLEGLRGVSIQKIFIPTKANMDGVSLNSYKLVLPNYFCYVPITSRNGEKITLALNETSETFIVSSAYSVFYCKEHSCLLPEYLFLWFNKPEFDRYSRFNSWGSAREAFSWQNMCLTKIPVPYKDGKPDLEKQQEVVDIWKGLKQLKEENEALAEPLLELCQSKIEELKTSVPMVELGEYIEQCDARNSDNHLGLDNLRGVSIEKKFIDSKANMEGVSLTPYKIAHPNDFCFVTITSRNGEKITLALNQSDEDYIVSSSYVVFKIKPDKDLDPTFLYLWFCRPEFDRYARFNSWGSAREAFSFDSMCRVKVPKPSIEVQRAIVDIYLCAKRAKEIAEEADLQLKTICPALMQHIIHG